jgi:hypothetical protein
VCTGWVIASPDRHLPHAPGSVAARMTDTIHTKKLSGIPPLASLTALVARLESLRAEIAALKDQSKWSDANARLLIVPPGSASSAKRILKRILAENYANARDAQRPTIESSIGSATK